jgi:hypothetical protein
VCARLLSNAARPAPQAGQTKPSGQRRSNRNAAPLVSSGKLAWNSLRDRALATAPPPRARRMWPAARLLYIIWGSLGQRDKPPSPSRCPVKGEHDYTGSGNYRLLKDIDVPIPGVAVQDNWRWCKKCQGLAFAGASPSRCPVEGEHDHTGSGNYTLIEV